MQYEIIVLLILLVVIGVGIGFIAALLGLGGGFLNIPTLMFLCCLDIHAAISTSLFIIVFTSSSATISYIKQKRILFKVGLTLEITTIIGGVLSSWLKAFIDKYVLSYIFSIAMLIVGVYIIYKSIKKNEIPIESEIQCEISPDSRFYYLSGTHVDSKGKTHPYEFNLFYVLPLSFFAGFISGLIGIGGGIVKVPLLLEACNIPVHMATATSSF
ncbi:MAG: sulfite exporter TauE/SafE family protein, partial [Candidatus Helarchaeales archaeon]